MRWPIPVRRPPPVISSHGFCGVLDLLRGLFGVISKDEKMLINLEVGKGQKEYDKYPVNDKQNYMWKEWDRRTQSGGILEMD